jgi:hypothetical protein
VSTNKRYTAQAVSFQIYEAEGTKAEQIGVELRVVDGPEAGKTIYWYGSLHENAQQYTVEALRSMGWSCNDIGTLEGLGSLKVIAVEKEETYKGKTRTKYMIFPVKTPKPTLEGAAKTSFASKFKALAASVKPLERTEMNAGLEELPEALPRNGTGAVAPSDGPATGGVPF